MTTTKAASILLVEDNPGDALLVENALSEHQVTANVVVLSDGEKAIQYVDKLEAEARPYPDLVILDLNLPKRTGTEVLGRIRESVHWNHIPVLVLTSSNAQQDREDTARLGANLYIRKPTRLAEFMEIGATLKRLLMSECA